MRPTQREIVDSLDVIQKNGYLTTGSFLVVTSSYKIRGFTVQNPKRGPYANDATTYIEVDADGSGNWYTLARGDRISWGVSPTDNEIKIRTNYNGAGYQLALAVDDDQFSGEEL